MLSVDFHGAASMLFGAALFFLTVPSARLNQEEACYGA